MLFGDCDFIWKVSDISQSRRHSHIWSDEMGALDVEFGNEVVQEAPLRFKGHVLKAAFAATETWQIVGVQIEMTCQSVPEGSKRNNALR